MARVLDGGGGDGGVSPKGGPQGLACWHRILVYTWGLAFDVALLKGVLGGREERLCPQGHCATRQLEGGGLPVPF